MYSVKDILEEKGYKIYTIGPEATVYEALKKMAGKNIGALLVMKDNQVVGVFSERDYARKIILKGKSSKESIVGDLLSERIFYVKPTATTDECMQIMTDHRVRHLPVMDEKKVIGIVSIGDIVNKIIQGHTHTIKQLEDYILGKTLP
ncbi:MAG: CBS domain-containing protein [Bacteroidales bacterium]|jgi:CBS domain-containing protein|nr:CBS domain-containing protein [Bacteroidales bacterium]